MASGPVIAAIDGEHARDTVALSGLLAQLLDAPVLVASVFPASAGDEEASLRERVVELSGDGFSYEVRALRDDSVGRALQELARRESAAALVVGSSERRRLGRVFPGRTADRLLRGAPCPVAVAPIGYSPRPLAKVGCAFNGSAESRAALALAAELAGRAGARLELLTCAEPPLVTPLAGPTYVELMAARLDYARRRCGEAASELHPAAEVVALEGDAAEAIAERSRELDLLVCGSRAYGPLHAVLVGGVSSRLVAAANCPVLVTPRGAGAADRPLPAAAEATS